VKFTPKGGAVKVKLSENDGQFQIVVKDNGQGISTDFLPYIFERFRQADGSSTRKVGGLGLGLAIVRYLVELHGGTIIAESAGAGQGATFTVSLPVVAEVLPENEFFAKDFVLPDNGNGAPKNNPIDLKNVRVLIVDDEPDARLLLTTIVENCGGSTFAANSVAEALEALKTFKPHVLVSDIGMPGEDGYVLIRKIRALEAEKHDSPLPAIALTAYAGAEDREQALNAGFQIHIGKPVNPEELVRVIAGLTRKAETRA